MISTNAVTRQEVALEYGVYLYCLAALESIPAVHALAGPEATVLDALQPTFPLEYKGIVAVAGHVPLDDFCDDNLRELEWVGPRAWRHEWIVETVMKASPVIPVKFATIFQSISSLTSFLATRRDLILHALDGLRHKSEWSVRGYLDEETARRRAALRSDVIRSRLEALSSLPGTRYFQQRQLDALVESEIRAWVEDVAPNIHGALVGPYSDAIGVTHPVAPVRVPERRMVFSGSFLVPDSTLHWFQARVAAQEKAFRADGLTFELQGPWPPHNFCPDLADIE